MVPPLFQHRTVSETERHGAGFRSPPQQADRAGRPCRMPVWHRVRGGYRRDRHPGAGRGVGRAKEARVAKAHKFALMGLAVGLAFTPTQAYAQQLGTPTENIAVSGQPVAAPTAAQVHVVLRSGAGLAIARASTSLVQDTCNKPKPAKPIWGADENATWPPGSVSPTPRSKLRRNGVNQPKFAEDAANKGKMQEAASWLKGITPNKQFLSAADKLRAAVGRSGHARAPRSPTPLGPWTTWLLRKPERN